jgi:ubiquinone/menaquinone biosynthesis C-methylase UbiE
MNYQKPDKKTHYKLIKAYFSNDANIRQGFYKKNTKSTIQKQINKRKMWKKYTQTIDKILQQNKEIASVIDAGCGMGHLIIELQKRKQIKKIIGIDFLRETLELAKENNEFKYINFIEADITKIPLQNQITDMTLCFNLIHHIHINDINKTINELARITKKYLIIEIRNKECTYNIWYKLINSLVYQKLPMYTLSINETEKTLNKQNFELIDITGKTKKISKSRRLILTFKRK